MNEESQIRMYLGTFLLLVVETILRVTIDKCFHDGGKSEANDYLVLSAMRIRFGEVNYHETGCVGDVCAPA